MEKVSKRILSGVQPSGDLHLGNYLGAIKNFVTRQKEFECFFCVVNLHAITVWQDPKILKQKTREVAAAFILQVLIQKKIHYLYSLRFLSMHSWHGFLIVWRGWDG